MSSNTKSGETPIQSQENIPQLCKGNCGFYGLPDQRGYCSVCFKKEVQKENKEQDTEPSVATRAMSDSPTAPMTDAMADLMKPTEEVKVETPTAGSSSIPPTPESPKPKRENPIVADQEEKPIVTSPPAKKQKKRCGICKKKLGLTGFECRCGFFYCGIHRYSDQHNCPFDYKTDGRKQIAAANPAVRGDKIQKL